MRIYQKYNISDLRPSIDSATGQVKLTRQFILYSIYAWGIPFIFVVIAKYMNHLDINYDLDGTRVSTNDGMIRPDFSGTKCVIRGIVKCNLNDIF